MLSFIGRFTLLFRWLGLWHLVWATPFSFVGSVLGATASDWALVVHCSSQDLAWVRAVPWTWDHACRVGEARRPGPLAISVCNPSGVASKEPHLLALPPGIVNISETHLSAVSQPVAIRVLRSLAQQANRRLRVLPGARVCLRPQSSSVGTWSGVMQLADIGGHQVSLPWTHNEHAIGRVMLSRFYTTSFSFLGGLVYGWPTSPTWTSAHRATAQLLHQLTVEIVHGSAGPRYLCGDFNGSFVEFEVWQAAGWVELQELSCLRFGGEVQPTFRGKTRPDRCFLSPELAHSLLRTEVLPHFADHAALVGHFDVPLLHTQAWRWPMTSRVPWSSVDLSHWQASPATVPPDWCDSVDSTSWFTQFGQAFDASFHGHCPDGSVVGSGLPLRPMEGVSSWLLAVPLFLRLSSNPHDMAKCSLRLDWLDVGSASGLRNLGGYSPFSTTCALIGVHQKL